MALLHFGHYGQQNVILLKYPCSHRTLISVTSFIHFVYCSRQTIRARKKLHNRSLTIEAYTSIKLLEVTIVTTHEKILFIIALRKPLCYIIETLCLACNLWLLKRYGIIKPTRR